MKFRGLICVFISLSLMLFSSCSTDNNIIESEKTLAYTYQSQGEFAANEYFSSGLRAVEYATDSDVVLAVENEKTDYGILDDFQYHYFVDNGRSIRSKELCEYTIDYCAYFSSLDIELSEAFNKAIKSLSENGTINKITDEHLKGNCFISEMPLGEKGTLVMLCDPSFPNRVYTNESGEVAGVDVDMARELCRCFGYELEIKTADFDELFLKLDNGEGDFILTASQVTEEREAFYIASDPYFTLTFHLIEKNK